MQTQSKPFAIQNTLIEMISILQRLSIEVHDPIDAYAEQQEEIESETALTIPTEIIPPSNLESDILCDKDLTLSQPIEQDIPVKVTKSDRRISRPSSSRESQS